jgi:hypothetical protein
MGGIIFIRLIDEWSARNLPLTARKPKESAMTTVTCLYPPSHSTRRSAATNVLRLASAPFLALRANWRRREAEKLLESLPADVRKDIGWPSVEQGPTAR